ncbi:hypothetical protein Dimus_021263 [Dionaea muscipula]
MDDGGRWSWLLSFLLGVESARRWKSGVGLGDGGVKVDMWAAGEWVLFLVMMEFQEDDDGRDVGVDVHVLEAVDGGAVDGGEVESGGKARVADGKVVESGDAEVGGDLVGGGVEEVDDECLDDD